MLVLGLHRDPFHHSGASVVYDDGKTLTVKAISEERLNRKKNSSEYPDRSIEYCLKAVGANSIEDCDYVVSDYFFRPTWNLYQHYKIYEPRELKRKLLFYYRLYRAQLTRKYKIPTNKIHFIRHHLAHAYTAFCPSGFDTAAVLIVDGHGTVAPGVDVEKLDFSRRRTFDRGTLETQSLFIGRDNNIELVEFSAKTGIGMLYEAFTKFVGFGEFEEGKTMGLAPLGRNCKNRYVEFNGSFKGIDTDYSYLVDIWSKINKGVKQTNLTAAQSKGLETNAYYSRIAWEVQCETEKAMIHLARYAREKTGIKNLCLAGGVALNSVANYKIYYEKIFDGMWIQPASSDCGIPIGCALYGYYQLAGGTKKWKEGKAYLGIEYDNDCVRSALSKYADRITVEENVGSEKVAELLANDVIIGWFQGASESGPRALGNRSILMDPRKVENKDILNSRVKFREGFRPFAPAVLVEYLQQYYDLDVPCPHMLMVPPTKEDKQNLIPAVVHVDGTGRVQTVSRDDNSRFYSLIESFRQLTGIPVILNTSFNIAGDPIVETPADAIRCFLGTQIDALVIGSYLIKKR